MIDRVFAASRSNGEWSEWFLHMANKTDLVSDSELYTLMEVVLSILENQKG